MSKNLAKGYVDKDGCFVTQEIWESPTTDKRLIAAAPELLDMVDQLASALCGMSVIDNPETRDNVCRAYLRKAKALMAKVNE